MANFINKRLNLHQKLQENQTRIQALEQEIQATQKLASLGTIACLAAHEFKNFLVPIINWAELALKNPDDSDLSKKALQKAVKQGNTAAEILQNMLGFAREQSDTPEEVPIAELVDSCFLCITRDFSKDSIAVNKDIPEDLIIQACQSQLQQVILNMLINARHAMLERGGTLTISAQKEKNDTITLTIKDTGCGIEEDAIEHIFDPFFSTKAPGSATGELRGNGLGLSVCKTIVEEHAGTIEVQSTLGQGTTFTICLPIKQTTTLQPELETVAN